MENSVDTPNIREKLESHGVQPTAQRVDIARLLFAKRHHFTADEIFRQVNEAADEDDRVRRASKATVYNTLGLFASKGLVKEVIVDPSRVFYDSYTGPHHHFFNTRTGELTDIDNDSVQVSGVPELPAGAELESVEVIVRWR